MKSIVKLLVPFVYEALVKMPRCSKPSLLVLRDTVEVEVAVVDSGSFPVAFKIGDTSLRWDGQKIWDFDFECVSGQENRKVAIDEVVENTNSGGATYKWSNSGAAAPFNNYWHGFADSMSSRHKVAFCGMDSWLRDENVSEKKDAVYRIWIDDNRDAVKERAKEIASEMLICDGFIYRKVGEPIYEVTTFGMGNNHGGTGIYIEQPQFDVDLKEYQFNALQYKEACEYGDKVAIERGDTDSIPMMNRLENAIEVLIADAVIFNVTEKTECQNEIPTLIDFSQIKSNASLLFF